MFEGFSSQVDKGYEWEQMLDYTNYYDDAVQGFPILVYAGEWDQRDGPST